MGFVQPSKQFDGFRLVTILQYCGRLFLHTSLAAKFYFVPGVELWFSAIVVSLSPQIALLRSVDWNQVIVSCSSMDWTWGVFYFFPCIIFFLLILALVVAIVYWYCQLGCSAIYSETVSASICSHDESCFCARRAITEHLKLLSFLFYSFSSATFWAGTGQTVIFTIFCLFFFPHWLCTLLCSFIFLVWLVCSTFMIDVQFI